MFLVHTVRSSSCLLFLLVPHSSDCIVVLGCPPGGDRIVVVLRFGFDRFGCGFSFFFGEGHVDNVGPLPRPNQQDDGQAQEDDRRHEAYTQEMGIRKSVVVVAVVVVGACGGCGWYWIGCLGSAVVVWPRTCRCCSQGGSSFLSLLIITTDNNRRMAAGNMPLLRVILKYVGGGGRGMGDHPCVPWQTPVEPQVVVVNGGGLHVPEMLHVVAAAAGVSAGMPEPHTFVVGPCVGLSPLVCFVRDARGSTFSKRCRRIPGRIVASCSHWQPGFVLSR